MREREEYKGIIQSVVKEITEDERYECLDAIQRVWVTYREKHKTVYATIELCCPHGINKLSGLHSVLFHKIKQRVWKSSPTWENVKNAQIILNIKDCENKPDFPQKLPSKNIRFSVLH